MKFKTGFGSLALLLTALLLLWLFSGDLRSKRTDAPSTESRKTESVVVAAQLSEAQHYQRQVVLQGQLEPWQSVDLRARINARLEALPLERGARVGQGDLLLQLSADDRRSQLQQA